MDFVIIQVWYYVGVEPVTIVTKNPLGGLTNVETTQTELDAKRIDPSKPWGDAEALAVAVEQLPAKPDFAAFAGLITVSLYEAPAPEGGE